MATKRKSPATRKKPAAKKPVAKNPVAKKPVVRRKAKAKPKVEGPQAINWKKGDRILTNYGESNEFYLATVLKTWKTKIRIQYDGDDWIEDLRRTSPYIFGRSTHKAKYTKILTKRQAMKMLEGSDEPFEAPEKPGKKKSAKDKRPKPPGGGLTAEEMQEDTPESIHNNSLEVRTKKQASGYSDEGYAQMMFVMESLKPTTRKIPRSHDVIIRLLDPEKKKLWVSCDCENFTFYCEYALTKKGASSIIYSNGEPPIVTNPTMINRACKHILKALNLRTTMTRLLKLDAKRK